MRKYVKQLEFSNIVIMIFRIEAIQNKLHWSYYYYWAHKKNVMISSSGIYCFKIFNRFIDPIKYNNHSLHIWIEC